MSDEVQDVEETAAEEQPEEFRPDEWMGTLEEETRAAVEKYHEAKTGGLKKALDAERSTRKDLEKQVRTLAAKAEKGSEHAAQLETLANELQEQSRRNEAFDVLHEAGVLNLKAAYTLAAADDLFDRTGNIDVDALKAAHPYLFPSRTARAHAGAGAGSEPTRAFSINDRIRSAAGY